MSENQTSPCWFSAVLLSYVSVCVGGGVCRLFNLPVLTNIPVKSLDKFSFSCAFGFPDPISTHLGSVPVFFPGYLSLVLLLVHFLLILQVDQEVLTDPCHSVFLASFLTHGN